MFDVYKAALEKISNDTQNAVTVCSSNSQIVECSDVAIIAVKPNDVDVVLEEIKRAYSQKPILLISICAGVPIKKYVQHLSTASSIRVARVMPNIACLISESATAYCLWKENAQDSQIVDYIFQQVGKIYKVKEELLDAVTGLSGSGPAYVFQFIEGLIDGGVSVGLTRDVASGLALQTVLGSVQYLLKQKLHPSIAKEQITSPGGTTIHGLLTLEKYGIKNALMEAVRAATDRSQQLSKL